MEIAQEALSSPTKMPARCTPPSRDYPTCPVWFRPASWLPSSAFRRLAASLAGAAALCSSSASAGLAQTFFVPLPEDQLRSSFQALYSSVGSTIDSSISIAPIQGDLVIYYDQWEDGYESDLEAPAQATTQIWGDNNAANGIPPGFATDVLTASSVITLRNLISLPRSSGTIRYDGRDRIGASKPLAVTRFAWATSPGSVLSCAVQINGLAEFGQEFESPAGQNMPNSAYNQMFEHVSMFIMASQDATTVQIDKDANGTFETTTVLNRGQSYHVSSGVLLGARVSSTLPVQVHLCTGDAGANYEARWLSLYPRTSWTHRYYTPVGTTVSTDAAATFLYNPNATSISVKYQTLGGSGTLSVPAKGTTLYTMPSNTGATFYTDGASPPSFFAFGAMDTDQSGSSNTYYEWGFSLVPDTFLTPALKIGSAPGAGDQPISGNGSPVWVMAVAATRLYIDYDGDPATGPNTDPNGSRYDRHIDTTALRSVRVFDTTDNDQTGLRVYTVDGTKITGAWGEDPASAEAGNPFLDLGYTVLPEPVFFARKTAELVHDTGNNGLADKNDTIEFTISINNLGVIPVNGIVLRDPLSTDVSYLAGTTTLDGTPVPDDVAPPAATVFPLDETGYSVGLLDPGQTKLIRFQVEVGDIPPGVTQITNAATVSIGGNPVVVTASVPTILSACPTITITSTPNPLLPGYVGSVYGADFTASGGTAPYTFSITGGAMPPGLTLSPTGQVTGTPTSTGTFYFDITATDAVGCQGTQMGTVATVHPANLGVGNLVFADANGNRVADAGEGVDGVTLHLFRSGDDPATATPVASAYTSAGGFYQFGGLTGGSYFVHIPANQFQTGNALAGLISLPGVQSGDDNAGEDGIDNASPQTNGISTGVFSLSAGYAPDGSDESGLGGSSDDATDDRVDLTIDLGFYRLVGVGNLVFVDANQNGRADAGEGVNGVTVKLFAQGANPLTGTPVATTTTASGGRYLFANVAPGNYFVHIPPAEFQAGGDLAGTVSLAGTNAGDDNAGEDGIDNSNPQTNGINSGAFNLAPGTEPSGSSEAGLYGTDDDVDDTHVDLTVDFGFYRHVGLGNLVFFDTNQNGHADPGEGVNGVTVQLYGSNQTPGVDTPLAIQVTTNGGLYLFSQLQAGLYKVHIPASMFASGAPLNGMISMFPGLSGDDDVGEDGVNSTNPATTGITSSQVYLQPGQCPTGLNGETGVNNASDDAEDAAVDLTIDFGFSYRYGVGNLVFVDSNGNGQFNSGEGIGGVTVQLFKSGSNPKTTPPLFSQETDASGHFFFDYLEGGNYFLHIPLQEFEYGSELYGLVSSPGTSASADSDDNVGEDGVDNANPATNGISTAVFSFTNNGEPTDSTTETGYLASEDNGIDDANIDLTKDFAFVPGLSVGNAVFVDRDDNGVFDPGEGVDGVLVQLFTQSQNPVTDSPIGSAITGSGGTYLFTGLAPGSYVTHIPASEFAEYGLLRGLLSIPGNGTDDGFDDDVNENGVDRSAPAATGISSTVFNLSVGNEPRSDQTETGAHNELDDGNERSGDMTIDFGFRARASVSGTVWTDDNQNGHRDAWEAPLPATSLLMVDANNDIVGTGTATSAQMVPPTSSTGVAQIDARFDESTRALDLSVRFGGLASNVTGAKLCNGPAGTNGTVVHDLGANGFPTGNTKGNYLGTFTLSSTMAAELLANRLYVRIDTASASAGEVRGQIVVVVTSDSTGLYAFAGVSPGNYAVRATPPAGCTPSAIQSSYPNDDLEDDSNIDTGRSPPAGSFESGWISLDWNSETLDNDGDANNNSSLDFGFAPPPGQLGVGNLVFTDANRNGHFDAGEGIDGVMVQIFRAGVNPQFATPVLSTLTSDGGRYLFGGLSAGTYFVHVPYYAFDTGAPLAGHVSMAGTSAGDDDAGEDGQDAEEPWVTGVSTANFQLQSGTEPTDNDTELGDDAASDNSGDNDTDLTIDLGFVVTPPGGTYSAWQMDHPLGGQSGPTQNPDGDLWNNLLEYGLNSDPATGVDATPPFAVTYNRATSKFEATFTRREGSYSDVFYTLQLLRSLGESPAGWAAATVNPTVTPNGDGTETVTFTSLEADTYFMGYTSGFVRLKADLDTNGDSVPDTSATTPVFGWSRVAMPVATCTFGNPYLKSPILSGSVDLVSGSVIDVTTATGTQDLTAVLVPGHEYYFEVTGGDHEGHRFEVDESSCTASTIAIHAGNSQNTLGSLPATLAGDAIVLREHQTMSDLFPTSVFRATNNQNTADRVLFYNGTTFVTYWLFSNSGNPRWVRSGDATLGDQNTRVIFPMEGQFLNPRTNSISLPIAGMVRANDFACPLPLGTSLVANAWPLDQSPDVRAMFVASGFQGTTNANTADRFQVWAGDATPGTQAYESFYLLKTATLQQWVRIGDASLTSQNGVAHFKALRSTFIKSINGNATYIMPQPWSP